MSFEFFIINPHLSIFFVLFFVGAILLVMVPLHYRWRTKRFPVFLTYKDFSKYSKFQKRLLILGICFAAGGILGAALVSEEYGYNRIVFDIHGNKHIESSKKGSPASINSSMKIERSANILVGRTIIPGSWDWDIEQNEIGGKGKTDLWWLHVNEAERYLAPRNGAKLSIIPKISFDKIDESYLNALEFNENRVSGSDRNPVLLPGTVIALLTAEGNLAKLKIVGFRALHDLSFREAEDLPAECRVLAAKKPNISKYHLEIEWVLFKRSEDYERS